MEKYSLSEVSSIISGYSAKKKDLKENEGTEVLTISVKDIDPNSIQINDDIGTSTFLDDYKAIDKFSLREDDIVITAKGSSLRAAIYKKSEMKIIPTSNLMIIRVKSERIFPDYLNVYLNSEPILNQVKSMLTGTSIMSLSIKDLSTLEVNIPSKEEQTKIIELAYEKERFVHAMLSEVKYMQLIVDITINKAILSGVQNG